MENTKFKILDKLCEKEKKNKIYKAKKQIGITLIALVVTIVVLLILAGITISLVFSENGIIAKAQEAKRLIEKKSKEEQTVLNTVSNELANMIGENQDIAKEKSEVEKAKDNGIKFETTTVIKDELENKITVPGGFHIANDSGVKVEEGIVIEDENGNQFVWIPVEEYNVTMEIDRDGTKDGKLTNKLTRRKWADANVVEEPETVEGDSVIDEYFYGEGDSRSVAKDEIEEFKISAINNRGFYIGRYEQGKGNVCQAGVEAFWQLKENYGLSLSDVKSASEEMYNENDFIVSQLISSYAWDTALNFICQTNAEGYLLATTTDNKYGNLNNTTTYKPTYTGEYKVNGKTSDKYSNIYDMLGNYNEFTTEYSSFATSINYDEVARGGNCIYPDQYAAARYDALIGVRSFRVQLYINN